MLTAELCCAIASLPACGGSELERSVSHQAHHGLGKVELLGHQGLRTGRMCRRSGLPPSAPCSSSTDPGATVLTAVAVILVLAVWAGPRAQSASSIPALPVGGGGGALALPAAPRVAIATVAAAVLGGAGATVDGAHSPVALILVHQVRIVRARAATEARSATWSTNSHQTGLGHMMRYNMYNKSTYGLFLSF